MTLKRWILPLSLLAACALLLAAPAQAGTSFVFPLDGFQEVPPGDPDASGQCVAILDDDETELTINCRHDVENAVAAHIHRAPRGQAGPIVFPLGPPPAGNPESPIFAVWSDDDPQNPLTPEMVAALKTEKLYVNVHSAEFPPGAVRGQITSPTGADEQRMMINLTGEEEVPPVDSPFSGMCSFELEDGSGTIEITCVHDIPNPTAAHIHRAPPGEAGPIIFPFDDPNSPIVAEWQPSPAEFQDLLDGNLYVNVHTEENPPGEIRGQLDGCISRDTSLCLQEGRFMVEVDFDTTLGGGASGNGQAVPETDDTGMFWFFEPNNLELLIKVIDGCTINDRFWVFFAGTTNVGFTLTVTDTEDPDRTQVVHVNEDLTPAGSVLDTEAFATCDVGTDDGM